MHTCADLTPNHGVIENGFQFQKRSLIAGTIIVNRGQKKKEDVFNSSAMRTTTPY